MQNILSFQKNPYNINLTLENYTNISILFKNLPQGNWGRFLNKTEILAQIFFQF